MGRLIIPANGWVIACDGSKSLSFQNAGDGLHLNLQLRQSRSHADAATHDIGTDHPGRSFASVGKRRSAVNEADLHDEAEQRFLKELADELERTIKGQDVDALVIIAPARAMGILRKCLGEATRAVLKAEIVKDFCKKPVAEIEAYLEAMREIA